MRHEQLMFLGLWSLRHYTGNSAGPDGNHCGMRQQMKEGGLID